MDEVIFEEFKGNRQLRDCSLIVIVTSACSPAIDILKLARGKRKLLVDKQLSQKTFVPISLNPDYDAIIEF
jgi:transcription termination factor Rho